MENSTVIEPVRSILVYGSRNVYDLFLLREVADVRNANDPLAGMLGWAESGVHDERVVSGEARDGEIWTKAAVESMIDDSGVDRRSSEGAERSTIFAEKRPFCIKS